LEPARGLENSISMNLKLLELSTFRQIAGDLSCLPACFLPLFW
jgi:hypothetical protein